MQDFPSLFPGLFRLKLAQVGQCQQILAFIQLNQPALRVAVIVFHNDRAQDLVAVDQGE